MLMNYLVGNVNVSALRALYYGAQCIIWWANFCVRCIYPRVQIMTLLERLQEQHGISYLFISRESKYGALHWSSHDWHVFDSSWKKVLHWTSYMNSLSSVYPYIDDLKWSSYATCTSVHFRLKGSTKSTRPTKKGVCLVVVSRSGRSLFGERPPLRLGRSPIACWHI